MNQSNSPLKNIDSSRLCNKDIITDATKEKIYCHMILSEDSDEFECLFYFVLYPKNYNTNQMMKFFNTVIVAYMKSF